MASVEPYKVDDTQPNRPAPRFGYQSAAFDDETAPHQAIRAAGAERREAKPRRQRSRVAVIVLSAVAALVVLGFSVWLILPPLMSPAPGGDPGYDFLTGESAQGLAKPGGDLLLETADHQVSVYVPQGAVLQDTIVVLQARDPDLTPELVTVAIERRLPVDIYGTSPTGEQLLIVALNKPVLLCYRPDEDQLALLEQGVVALAVQRYDDLLAPQEWIDLPVVTGWETQQVCAQTAHFSLFALGSKRVSTPVPKTLNVTPTAILAPQDLYTVPTATP